MALFWDQSLLWGLLCVETLAKCGVPFDLLSAQDIAGGCLKSYRVLLVPGGWASHKVRALGSAGKEAIRNFVEEGGSYLGFCGGAGLALSSPPSLELAPLKRMPLSERLPSASGGVRIRAVEGRSGHPAWRGLPDAIDVPVWWPSQFQWEPLPELTCLASYEATGPDFLVSDLPAQDIEPHGIPWEVWESIYGINLNPRRLMGHPAIIEARLKRGRLILSYPHLETPGSISGNRLFLNFLSYLDGEAAASGSGLPCASSPGPAPAPPSGRPASPALTAQACDSCRESLARMRSCVEDLVLFGECQLMWKWRSPWLLQWRRGVRGLEYGTLAVIVRLLARDDAGWMSFAGEFSLHAAHGKLHGGDAAKDALGRIVEEIGKIDEDIGRFCRMARRLLIEEKLATQTGHLSKLGSVNESVDELRRELFGDKMNHGGLCRTLFDRLDSLLLHVLRRSPKLRIMENG